MSRRRTLFQLTAVVAVLWSVYLLAANLFLATDLGPRTINRKPEKLEVEWRRAWSWVPGLVEVRGLRIRVQNRKVQWRAEIESAKVPISLHLLPLKRFQSAGVRGTGLDFRLRRRLDAFDEDDPPDLEALKRWAPEIPGLDNPPAPPPEELYERADGGRPWRVELLDLKLRSGRQIWIDSVLVDRAGDLSADFDFTVGRELELEGSALTARGAELIVAGETAARELDLDLSVQLAPFEPRGMSAPEVLRQMSGSARAKALAAELPALDPFLHGAEWLNAVASGKLEGELQLERGEIRPPTFLNIDAERVALDIAGNRVAGKGSAQALVESDDLLTMAIDLQEVELRRLGADEPHAAEARFQLTASSRRLALHDAPFTDLQAVLELNDARVDDFANYNGFLISAESVVLGGGPAFLSGRFEASVADRSANGELQLSADRISAQMGDVHLEGALAFRAQLKDAAFDERRYDLSGSSIELTDVEVREHADRPPRSGWWMKIVIDDGELRQHKTAWAQADLRATMRDSGPVVALVASKRRLVQMIDRVLTVKDVVAKARVSTRPRSLGLQSIDIRGGRLEILGDAEISRGDRDGLLFLRLGPLSSAVELDGTERDWKLVRPRAWFEKRRSERAKGEP